MRFLQSLKRRKRVPLYPIAVNFYTSFFDDYHYVVVFNSRDEFYTYVKQRCNGPDAVILGEIRSAAPPYTGQRSRSFHVRTAYPGRRTS